MSAEWKYKKITFLPLLLGKSDFRREILDLKDGSDHCWIK